MNIEPRCPYCGINLKVQPQKKKKCPTCKRPIYVKSTPDDRSKRLMTEDQAEEAESLWNDRYVRQKSIAVLQSVGLGESDLDLEKARSKESDWNAAIALLQRVAVTADGLHQRKMAFYQLALQAEKDGLPFAAHLTEAARLELRILKQTAVVKKVEILTSGAGNSCPECEAQRGKTFEIDEALRAMPLPCQACSRTLQGTCPGFCRCTWVAAFD